MTELERAKAHLLDCQDALAHTRRIGWSDYVTKWREQTVLAALSWVWEEQNRTDEDYVFPRIAGNKDLGFVWE